jgi:hypothetical protein
MDHPTGGPRGKDYPRASGLKVRLHLLRGPQRAYSTQIRLIESVSVALPCLTSSSDERNGQTEGGLKCEECGEMQGSEGPFMLPYR